MPKKEYEFEVHLVGYGETSEEAWDDAVDGFIEQPGAHIHNKQ